MTSICAVGSLVAKKTNISSTVNIQPTHNSNTCKREIAQPSGIKSGPLESGSPLLLFSLTLSPLSDLRPSPLRPTEAYDATRTRAQGSAPRRASCAASGLLNGDIVKWAMWQLLIDGNERFKIQLNRPG